MAARMPAGAIGTDEPNAKFVLCQVARDSFFVRTLQVGVPALSHGDPGDVQILGSSCSVLKGSGEHVPVVSSHNTVILAPLRDSTSVPQRAAVGNVLTQMRSQMRALPWACKTILSIPAVLLAGCLAAPLYLEDTADRLTCCVTVCTVDAGRQDQHRADTPVLPQFQPQGRHLQPQVHHLQCS